MFACIAHDGQVDKVGEPYILHPIRVMLSLNTDKERMTAILHDVVEDTNYTIEDVACIGVPFDVLDAVDAMTRRKGQTYEDYLKEVKENSLALTVKLADIRDNQSPIRLLQLDTDKRQYLVAKYKKAVEYLS